MIVVPNGPIPYFVADGTNVFWHPKKGVAPYGAAHATSTAASSIFADVTALLGKSKIGAQVWIQQSITPTAPGIALLRADFFLNDEATALFSVIIGSSPIQPIKGPFYVPSGVHGASAGATTGGFCVKLIDVATGASPGAATYAAHVWYVPESNCSGG